MLNPQGLTWTLTRNLKNGPLAYALWRSAEYHAMAGLPLEGPLLDLGCGEGWFADAAFAGKAEAGIDVDLSELKRCRRVDKHRAVLQADGRRLPFADESFQTVFSNCVIEHVENVDALLRECGRVLRPGGRMVFTVPSERFSEELYQRKILESAGLKKLGKIYSDKLNGYWRHHNMFPPEEWSRRLEGAGMTMTGRRYFMAPEAMKWFDLMLWPAFAAYLIKKRTGAWFLFPFLPDLSIALFRGKLKRLIERPCEGTGAGLLVTAEKQTRP